jgi:hypothetical protein
MICHPERPGSPAGALAGWGGEARDLQFAEYQTNRGEVRQHGRRGDRRGRAGAAIGVHAPARHHLVWTGLQHLFHHPTGSAAGSHHGRTRVVRHVRECRSRPYFGGKRDFRGVAGGQPQYQPGPAASQSSKLRPQSTLQCVRIATGWRVYARDGRQCLTCLCLPKCTTEPRCHSRTMRDRGELSISISVLPAFHFAQQSADYFVGASAKQDGELKCFASEFCVAARAVY